MDNIVEHFANFCTHQEYGFALYTFGIILFAGICYLAIKRLEYIKAQCMIEIKKESEKIQYNIQRNYMLTEIRTKHLLTIYPRLYKSLRLAGPLCVVIDTIKRKIDEEPLTSTEEIQALIKEHFDYAYSEHPDLGLQQLANFANHYEESLLYISQPTDELLQKVKSLLLDLYRLIKNKIISGEYEKYDKDACLDLINSASSISMQLKDFKYKISRTMNKELNAEDNE
jgi:hypothetical protein